MVRTANNNLRSGAALLITLFIIMAIVVISLGFLNNSSTQLRTGSNFAMRGRIDYLAQSALTHAKTLITNPQDADTSADRRGDRSAGNTHFRERSETEDETGIEYDIQAISEPQ